MRDYLCLVAWVLLIVGAATAQEVVLSPPRSLPESKGSTDADVESNYARGEVKHEEVCGRVKSKLARSSFNCDKASSLKDVKKIWERNEENSAWEAIAALDGSKFGKEETQKLVDQIMEDALGSIKIHSGKLSFGKVSPAETTGRIIFACGQQPNCLKRTLTPNERVAVAEYLLSVNPLSSGVALGLKALSDFGMVSLAVNQPKNSVTASITASSLIGKPVTWKTGKATSPLVSTTGKGDEVKVTFDAKQGKVANVPVVVELPNGLTHTINLAFDVTVEVKSGKVVVKEKTTVVSDNTIGDYPSKLSKVVALDRNAVLEVSISVTSGGASLCPEQASFGFVATDGSGMEYLVPGTCTDKEVRAAIPNGHKLAEELRFASGKYDVVFIGSDDRMSNPTLWRLATVELSLSPVPDKKHEALFTHHLLYESDTTLKALPEIHHQFRQPDRRAPMVLAMAFSLLQVGFLGAMVSGLVRLGFKPLEAFTTGRVALFAFTLAFVEAVLAWYWLGLSGAPNMENLTYKYIPILLIVLLMTIKQAFPKFSPSGKKTASM